MVSPYHGWAFLASHWIGEVFDHCKPLMDKDYSGLPPLVRFVNSQLLIACHLTSESALLLTREKKVWDADVLLRSVLEGTVKHAYMLQGTEQNEWNSRCDEYWHRHPDVVLKKDCSRAKELKELIIRMEGDAVDGIDDLNDVIFTEESLGEFWSGVSSKERQELEYRWSVGGILSHFKKSKDESINVLHGLLYQYGVNCHLSHLDGIGVRDIWGRYRLDEEMRAADELAHAARIVGDIVEFAKIRAISLTRACNVSFGFISELNEKYSKLTLELRDAYTSYQALKDHRAFEGVRAQIVALNMPGES